MKGFNFSISKGQFHLLMFHSKNKNEKKNILDFFLANCWENLKLTISFGKDCKKKKKAALLRREGTACDLIEISD